MRIEEELANHPEVVEVEVVEVSSGEENNEENNEEKVTIVVEKSSPGPVGGKQLRQLR